MHKDIENNILQVNSTKHYAGFSECIRQTIQKYFAHLFPGYFTQSAQTIDYKTEFFTSLTQCLKYVLSSNVVIEKICDQIMEKLPTIYQYIICDIDAAYRGDPATKNYDEIILAYPGFQVVAAYRLAHELYVLGVPILPRAISEYEHSLAGIDIHPGATIGKCFFIDHGTGVVIGETAVIGNNVTIYQNVTLGAKSFPHDNEGNLIKGTKRHPNIGNNVVIYAGATILGNITIPDNEVIPGNS